MILRSLASLRLAAFLAALLAVTACDGDRPEQLSAVQTIDVPAAGPGAQANQNIANPTLEIPVTYPVKDGDELTLVWSDEFDGPEIDPGTWFFATGDGSEVGLPGGWGNNELQYYLPDNAMIVNGVLEITARRETVGDLSFTSARINTQDRFAFKYGRIEASIKMPGGQGLWPAFWMLSQDSDYLCSGDPCVWAAIGEIDIVEAVNLDGTGGNEIFATIHYGDEFPANQSTESRFTPSVDVTETFNTYALEWDVDEIRWYFNGELYAMQPSSVWFSAADNAGPNGPFDQNFHILLNLAVGGDFPGSPNGTTPWPVTMEVDWVRVYSGEPPPAGAGDVPENAVFVTDPNVTADLAGVLDNFGSGATFNQFYAGDPDFKPTLQVTSGNAYENNPDVGFVAFTLYDAGFAADFETLSFKVKGLPGDELEIKFFGSPENSIIINLSTYPGAVDIGNGWYQVTIPMSDFVANVYAFTGFLIGPPGDQGAPFSFLLTDIGFDGSIVTTPADAGTTPDVTLYARGGVTDLVENEDFTVSGFDSGSLFNRNNTGDVDFSPAFSVTTGNGYTVQVGQLAFLGFGTGFAAGYDTLDFKVKGMNNDIIRLKLLEAAPSDYVDITLTSSDFATDLGNGWYQVSVPLETFGNVATADSLLFETGGEPPAGAFTFLLNDIGFSGTAVASTDPVVFADDFGTGVSFAPFGGSVNDVSVDTTEAYSGSASLKALVPAGGYTGGALVVSPGRDVSGYDRLTFWAKADGVHTLNVVGIGNDAVDPNPNQTEVTALGLTTEWQQFTITIPDPSVLTDNTGLFHFAEGSEEGAYTIWFDEIQYETTPVASTDPVVFADDFGTGVSFAPFGGSVNDVSVDTTEAYSGSASLKALVPAGGYTGGALVVSPGRDVSGYDRLTFWAKADGVHTLNVVGIGNDAVDPNPNQTEVTALGLTTEWQQFTITIPDPSVLTDNTGLFHFAEGSEEGAYTIWFDEIQYETTPVASTDPVVFADDFGTGVSFAPFGGSVNDVSVDTTEAYSGSASLKALVPAGGYTGGALVVSPGRDVSGYDRLTFWAKADGVHTLNVVGIGNDAVDPNPNQTEVTALGLTTEWQQFTITIPDPSVLTDNTGLFHFAEGSEEGAYTIWFDEIQYETTPVASTDPVVFADDFGTGVSFAPFGGSVNDVSVDTTEAYSGSASLKALVPAGGYTGGALVVSPGRDVSGYDRLTFWAKADGVHTLNVVGIGNDAVDPNPNQTEVTALGLTTEWQQFTITIPDPSVLTDNTGLFHFAEGSEEGAYTIWFDEITYEVSGGGMAGGNLAINGDFEAADTSGWTFEANAGTFSATTAQANGGSYSGNLVASVPGGGGPASFPVIKQANVGVGTVQPNATVTVSFDLFGSVSGAGGVFFAEFFSELSGGGTSSSEILSGGPLFPDGTWTTYSFTPMTGADVSGGVTLQLKADCGANPGCTVDAYIDNVTITTN